MPAMVSLRQPLNSRQLEVLGWIADGCPDGVMANASYKLTAGALRDRRLVTISKKGGTWRAALTERGTYYLVHGAYPDDPAPNKPADGDGRARHAGMVAIGEQRRAAAEKLLGRLEAERRVVIARPSDDELAIWRKVIDYANRHEMAPTGTRITRYKTYRGLEIELCKKQADAEGEDVEPLAPVPVPAQLRKPHAVVQALQHGPDQLQVTKDVRSRALRIVQALVAEAQRRGYQVSVVIGKQDRNGFRQRSSRNHFAITVKDHPTELRLVQEHDRVEHVPTAKELAEKARYPWTRIPTHDQVPNQRLRLELDGGCGTGQAKWADRRSWTLEEKLPEVLREVAARGDAAERRRLAEERARLERRRQWEAAMVAAKERATQAYFADRLIEQAERWRQATELRAYCAALAERLAGDDDRDPGAAESTCEWLRWAHDYIERLDPLHTLPTMPPPPELKPNDLQPYLGTWSPYGPPDVFGRGYQ